MNTKNYHIISGKDGFEKLQYSVEKNTNSSRMLTIDDRAISLSRNDAKKKCEFLAFCIPILLIDDGIDEK